MNKKLIEEFKNILIPAEFYTDKVYTELSLSKEESMTILKYINNLEKQNIKYKEVLDKIKEKLEKKKEKFDVYEPYGTPTGLPNYSEKKILLNANDILELLEEIE